MLADIEETTARLFEDDERAQSVAARLKQRVSEDMQVRLMLCCSCLVVCLSANFTLRLCVFTVVCVFCSNWLFVTHTYLHSC